MSLRMDDYPPTMTFVQELCGCRIYRQEETGVHYIIATPQQGRSSCIMMLNSDGSPFAYMPNELPKIKALEDFDSMTRLQRKQRRRWIALFVAAQIVAAALAAIITVNIFS